MFFRYRMFRFGAQSTALKILHLLLSNLSCNSWWIKILDGPELVASLGEAITKNINYTAYKALSEQNKGKFRKQAASILQNNLSYCLNTNVNIIRKYNRDTRQERFDSLSEQEKFTQYGAGFYQKNSNSRRKLALPDAAFTRFATCISLARHGFGL